MDPRQYHQRNPWQQPPPQDNRFSWQLPIDRDVQLPQPQSQAPSNAKGSPVTRQSWVETPTDMRSPQNWPRGAQRPPNEPTIPQSPTSPVSPETEKTSPMPQATLPTSQSISSQTTSHQAFPYSPAQASPAAEYALPPPNVNAPFPALSLPVQTGDHKKQDSQNTLTSGGVAPISMSPLGHGPPHTPATATSEITNSPYTPHATISKSTFSSNGETKSGQPFAPDDLLQTHQAAAKAQGLSSSGPLSPVVGLESQAHLPGQSRHPNMMYRDEGKKEWQHGLMSCGTDVNTCCLGLACPCILHSKTSYRLSARSEKRDPTDMLGFKALNGTCLVVAASLCLGFVFPAISRTRIRHEYGIEGGVGGDFCDSCACCCCVVVQNEREVRDREDSRRRWAGPAAGTATAGEYVAPTNEMRYAPGGGY